VGPPRRARVKSDDETLAREALKQKKRSSRNAIAASLRAERAAWFSP